jgi:hypothetical protein
LELGLEVRLLTLALSRIAMRLEARTTTPCTTWSGLGFGHRGWGVGLG